MWAGPASLYVLVALADSPAHGLGIAENVSRFTDGAVLLGPGTLYRVLKDLSSEGLIARADPPEDENPHRKYYEITSAGRLRLEEALSELRLVVTAATQRLDVPQPAEA